MVVSASLNKRSQGTPVATLLKYFFTSKDTAEYFVSFFSTDLTDFDRREL